MRTRSSLHLLQALVVAGAVASSASGAVPDTGQAACYDDHDQIPCPQPGDPFFGQDAQYSGPANDFVVSPNGTVTDRTTGLMWQQSPDLEVGVTFNDAVQGAGRLDLGGYHDWRLPTITELYSLIDFRGSSRAGAPYIDPAFFDFRFGDPSRGERLIDIQFWSSTEYVGTVFGDAEAVFGVNFADGRIKAYPKDRSRRGGVATHFVRYVRGNPDPDRGVVVDNGDGTVSDLGTGLMWQRADSGVGMSWERALAYAEGLGLAGYEDWRLPNAKELQSLVDYFRAPDARDPSRRGPAIDPVFEVSDPESWYWTGTTLLEAPPMLGWGSHAVYVAFGQAFGVFGSGLVNVHGAGAQRSDPKSGDPKRFGDGFGPQNDQIRILNRVRCVRGGGVVLDPSPSGEAPKAPQAVHQVAGRTSSPREPRVVDQGGSGSRDRMGGRRGPVACTTQSDCLSGHTCPPDAVLGCSCSAVPGGGRACIPVCRADADCPSPPGMSLRCGERGVCVPSRGQAGRRPEGAR